MFTTKHYYSNMIKFIRTNQNIWDSVDKTLYSDSIVFIEDTEQIYSNGLYYGENNNGLLLEKITFSEESILLNPDKFYVSDTILGTLDITLTGDATGANTYFVEFLCNNTCVILPSNIKWKNNTVPDFSKLAIMTVKIQDDTAYLIDCRPLYPVQYTAAKKIQPNRADAFGSEIVGVTESEFLLNGPATEIKESAFEGNQDLISITIPNTIKRIGSKAFSGCSNLQDMEYEGSSKDWNNIELGSNWNEGTQVESVESVDGDVYLKHYVTFAAQQDNSSIGLEWLSTNQTLEYSRDGSNWSNMNTSTNISLNNRDKVYVRGILSSDNTNSNHTQFKMSGKIAASGNCNAIWNYHDLNAPLKEYCGFSMFESCGSLTIAPELPATTLTEWCYYGMFSNCTSLTSAPELPATELAERCYTLMFSDCTSLTTAPELPATTLAASCYKSMFQSCSSLTTVPELPATTLVENCYQFMFNRCASLNYIKCLATDISADDCTYYWVNNVYPTGTFIKHPDMNNWLIWNNGIPIGWTIENAKL